MLHNIYLTSVFVDKFTSIHNIIVPPAKRGELFEFSDICKKYLGKPGELIAVLFSLAAIAGSAIVFWVLMSNFLFNSGKYIEGI